MVKRIAALLLAFLLTLGAGPGSGLCFAQESGAEEASGQELLPESWFDDALFIGDSMTGDLRTYSMLHGGLGQAKLIYVNGLGCHHIVERNKTVGYMGQACTPEQAVELAGAGKLFFLLAANDVGTPIEEMEDCWRTMLETIRAACPDTMIYLQSGTPFRSDAGDFNRKNMGEYNDLLRRMCEEYGCVFVDITKGLVTEDGFMIEEYRNDIEDNVHMNPEGCKIWLNNLRDPASYSVRPQA